MPLEFKASSTSTLGMEMELQLLDARSYDLVDGIMTLMEAYPDDPFIKPEFSQSTVEINSKVSDSIHDVETHMHALLRDLDEQCRQAGMRLCSAGTHPFCNRLARITPLPRYLDQERLGGYLGHTLMTYALHVHVGMASGAEALRVMRYLKPYLPIFLALSASSPFWWGHDSGYAAYRHRVLAAMRSYGIPPGFSTWEEFSSFFATARYAGIFETMKDIHWDIRPRPDFGTLELRVMDAQPSLGRAMTLVSFVRLLMNHLKHRDESESQGYHLRPMPWWIEKENHFRASREGLEAYFIEDERGNSRPMREVVEDVARTLAPTAEQAGETDYLERLVGLLGEPPAYERQREVYGQTGSLRKVAVFLADELNAGLAAGP